MIKFPYGISDFRDIITQGYYYRDRTHAIPFLELNKSTLFIRPRRFGKSLVLSMLENYYDIARKEAFDTLFGKLAIGLNPTLLRNSYFILRWDFSCVDPTGSPQDVKRSLYDYINGRIRNFLRYYRNNGFDLQDIEIHPENALATIESLLGGAQSTGYPVFLLIDEYDNFANTIMMLPVADSQARYAALVHDEGMLRTLFKVVKSATSGTGFDRVFITGVSPVVMSDITSGYNIAEDMFFEPEFADLCGFREHEVAETLREIASGCGMDISKTDEALEMMRIYYNGYNFVPGSTGFIYNPTLCLYFFKQFQKRCAYPRKMLDANLSVDQSKLEYVCLLPGGRELVTSLANTGQKVAVTDIVDRFGLSEMLSDDSKDRTFIISFLYYFGVLTLAGKTDTLQLVLKVPNQVMQSLYVERVQRMMLPDPVIRDRGKLAAEQVYQKGDIEPLCTFVQYHIFSVFKNRDYALANELTVKTAFLALLYNDILYIMDSEPELERRYADLTMIIRPDMRHGKILDVLIEFKFLSLKTLGLSGEQLRAMTPEALDDLPEVKQALDEGKSQIMDYGNRLARKYPALRLKSFVVVALGFERICFLPG
jgi:hypothetical protein